MKIYLAGPMSGYAAFNYPAFNAAAKKLRDEGHTVFNPAERDIQRDGKDWGEEVSDGNLAKAAEKGFCRRTALCDDLTYICKEADAIALLPGWDRSTGAKAERAAAVALGLKVMML